MYSSKFLGKKDWSQPPALPGDHSLIFPSRQTHLPGHDQAGRLVGDLEDHATVAGPQLTDLFKVIVLQLSHLLLLGEKGLKSLPLLLVQLQLLQLLLQGLQIGPAQGGSTSQHQHPCPRTPAVPMSHPAHFPAQVFSAPVSNEGTTFLSTRYKVMRETKESTKLQNEPLDLS